MEGKYGNNKNFQIRHFNTEYRLPMILADFNVNKPDEYTMAWLTVTLPPYKSKESFILRGKMKKEDITDDLNFIEMMDKHFTSLWDRYEDESSKVN